MSVQPLATDLTTLANVKAWLVNFTTVNDDDLLQRLISAASLYIQKWINRNIISQSYTETYNGSGGYNLSLLNMPVTAVSSLTVDGITIPAAGTPLQPGYSFDTRTIYLNGYRFTRAPQNVQITYTAGYATVPLDLEQACIDLVVVKYKERDRIGEVSRALGGQETVSYSQKDLPPNMQTLLNQYKRVAPI